MQVIFVLYFIPNLAKMDQAVQKLWPFKAQIVLSANALKFKHSNNRPCGKKGMTCLNLQDGGQEGGQWPSYI
jgi:hypothetical protein